MRSRYKIGPFSLSILRHTVLYI